MFMVSSFIGICLLPYLLLFMYNLLLILKYNLLCIFQFGANLLLKNGLLRIVEYVGNCGQLLRFDVSFERLGLLTRL